MILYLNSVLERRTGHCLYEFKRKKVQKKQQAIEKPKADGAGGKVSGNLSAKKVRARVKLGKAGEKLAKKYLKKQGYRHLKSNYNTKQGEIDLIMRDGVTFVFVEVKTRRSEEYVRGEAAVNYKKQKHIASAARHFIHVNNLYDSPCRFDVVVVVKPEKGKEIIRHQENAFRLR